MSKFIFIFVFLLAHLSNANVRSDHARGESTHHFPLADRAAESCVVPKHFAGSAYRTSDAVDEQTLCAMEIGRNTAACAKINSTNPGLNFYRTPLGLTTESLQARNCMAKGAKLDGKYKVSSSCSYTPSILGYYHLSRYLGDILHVPVAVMRTLDLERHRAITVATLPLLPRDSIIWKTWSSLQQSLAAGRTFDRAERLLLDDVDQTYGALQLNPRNEFLYEAFINEGADKVAAFVSDNKIFKRLRESELETPRAWSQANVQSLVELRDAADMILLDTILSQQDRIRNTHYIEVWYSRSEHGVLQRTPELPLKAMAPIFRIRELMLKDNDCGIVKTNRFKNAGFLQQIRHLSRATYSRLLALDHEMNTMRDFMIQESLFTEADFEKVRVNVSEAAHLLRERCRRGHLKLDLDVEPHFDGSTSSWSCEPTF